MTNKEKFKDEIFEIACVGGRIGFDTRTNELCSCDEIKYCEYCLFKGDDCNKNTIKWCNEEYKEPCPFEEGELVEVSDDGEHWVIGRFNKMIEGRYRIDLGKTMHSLSQWRFCQKYGTLCGLVKGEQYEADHQKQIPKKPLMRYENMGLGISPNESIKVFGCPCCKEEIDEDMSFCQNCGQKIDWKGEN